MQKEEFLLRYKVVETISENIAQQKTTSIVVDANGRYYIAKQYSQPFSFTEIDRLQRLPQANIVSIRQSFKSLAHLIIIEQYCEEGDLRFHIGRGLKSKKIFPQTLIARWTFQILLALEFLHANAFLHKGVTPKHIFLTQQGNVKLSPPTENISSSLLHRHNRPPELKFNLTYDSATDIWAFGSVIHEICSLANLHLPQIRPDAKKLQLPTVYSKDLNEVFVKCLSMDAKIRPTARELLRTDYYIEAMKNFVQEKFQNIRIPIKKYKIHKLKEKKNYKKIYKGGQVRKKYEKNKKSQEKIKNSIEKMKKSQEKLKKSQQKRTDSTKNTRNKSYSKKQSQNSMKMSTPKSMRLQEKHEIQKSAKSRSKTKENSSKELKRSAKSQQQIFYPRNQKVLIEHNSHFQKLNFVCAVDSIEFEDDNKEADPFRQMVMPHIEIDNFSLQIELEESIRLTKSTQPIQQLMESCKGKLTQAAEEILSKYQVNLTTIIEQATEFESNKSFKMIIK